MNTFASWEKLSCVNFARIRQGICGCFVIFECVPKTIAKYQCRICDKLTSRNYSKFTVNLEKRCGLRQFNFWNCSSVLLGSIVWQILSCKEREWLEIWFCRPHMLTCVCCISYTRILHRLVSRYVGSQVYVRKLLSCLYGAPSLTRGRACSLQCNHSMVRVTQNP
jgi:hypothetical protein